MRRRTGPCVAALILALVLGGCGGGEDGTDASTTTTPDASTATTATTSTTAPTGTAPSTTTSAPPSSTTTAGPGTTTTTSPIEPGPTYPDDIGEYADELVRAWGLGDRSRAGELALPSVVDRLFAFRSPGGPHWDRSAPCEGAAGTTYCTYTDTETGEQLEVDVRSMDHGMPQAVRDVDVP